MGPTLDPVRFAPSMGTALTHLKVLSIFDACGRRSRRAFFRRGARQSTRRRGRPWRHPRPIPRARCEATGRPVARSAGTRRSTIRRRRPPLRRQVSRNQGAEGVRRRLRLCARQDGKTPRRPRGGRRHRNKQAECRRQSAAVKGRARASHRERLRINVAEDVPPQWYGSRMALRHPKRLALATPLSGGELCSPCPCGTPESRSQKSEDRIKTASLARVDKLKRVPQTRR